jgi:hypothetical protein
VAVEVEGEVAEDGVGTSVFVLGSEERFTKTKNRATNNFGGFLGTFESAGSAGRGKVEEFFETVFSFGFFEVGGGFVGDGSAAFTDFVEELARSLARFPRKVQLLQTGGGLQGHRPAGSRIR